MDELLRQGKVVIFAIRENPGILAMLL